MSTSLWAPGHERPALRNAVLACALLALGGCGAKFFGDLTVAVIAETIAPEVRRIALEMVRSEQEPEQREELVRQLSESIAAELASSPSYICLSTEKPEACLARLRASALRDVQRYREQWDRVFNDCTLAVLQDPRNRGTEYRQISSARMDCVAARGFAKQVDAIRRFEWS